MNLFVVLSNEYLAGMNEPHPNVEATESSENIFPTSEAPGMVGFGVGIGVGWGVVGFGVGDKPINKPTSSTSANIKGDVENLLEKVSL
mmetsp:Transcript_14361/g.29387  ORF Transcript_14361/g.29387 Transcript_14361/m.29387 type:complete len:88 (+) Transcript_14361:2803-3066(+)